MIATGVAGVKAAGSVTKTAATKALTTSTVRNPNCRRMGRAANFRTMAPIAEANVIRPDWNGDMPKPTCSISGRRNGVAPTPMRNRKLPRRLAPMVGIRSSDRSTIGLAIRRPRTM